MLVPLVAELPNPSLTKSPSAARAASPRIRVATPRNTAQTDTAPTTFSIGFPPRRMDLLLSCLVDPPFEWGRRSCHASPGANGSYAGTHVVFQVLSSPIG